MAPILGIYASAMQPALNASSYESIATVTVSSGNSITFSSIPSTYTHLQIRFIAATTAGGIRDFYLQLNGDTGNNYATHLIRGDGSSASAYALSTTNITFIPQVTTATNIFTAGVIDILDYKNTNKYKTIRSIGGYDTNGAGRVGLYSGLWQNTNAVTSITIYENTGITAGSTFALYGIKG